MILEKGSLISPPIWIDFMRTRGRAQLRMDCPGTLKDVKRYDIELRDGLRLLVYDEDGDDEGLVDDLIARSNWVFAR